MERTRRPGPAVRVRVIERADGAVIRREDRLATEEPLEVRAAWPGAPARRVAVTMRTPGHDFELATGLLHAEGVVGADGVRSVAYCTDEELSDEQEFNVVTVTLAGVPPRPPRTAPDTVTAAASACGVCGAQSIDEVLDLGSRRPGADHPPEGGLEPRPDPDLDPEALVRMPERLREGQRVFGMTGGLHAAGLFDRDGRLLVLREDIGRHNAVDKVVGSRLLGGAPTAVPLLGVSGRVGFEIAQKAIAAGIGVVAAIGAPSSLAVRLAEEAGLGLVGFVSARRFVVYAGADRVAGCTG